MSKGDKIDKKDSTQATQVVEFKPTPHMIVWLDTQVRMKTDVIDHIAKKSGIQESTWYKWLKKDGFEDWYWPEYDRRMRRLKPLVDRIGMKYAERGSAKHFELMAKRVGNVADNNRESLGVEMTNGNDKARIIITRGK